jgi:hypothetical protein
MQCVTQHHWQSHLGVMMKRFDWTVVRSKADPLPRNLHRDPRWQAFLQKMKLPL